VICGKGYCEIKQRFVTPAGGLDGPQMAPSTAGQLVILLTLSFGTQSVGF